MKKINMDMYVSASSFSRVLERVTKIIQKIENELNVELDFEINVILEDDKREPKKDIEEKK